MPVLPPTRLAQIQFFETHLPVWASEPEAIGLTADQVADLQMRTNLARANYEAAQTARENSRNATVGYHQAVDAMRELGGSLINAIKAFAAATGDPKVYTTAQVPPPSPRKPAPPPAAPAEITTTMQKNGAVMLRWKLTQPAPGAETFVSIARQLNGVGEFVLIGTTGEKKFVDEKLPPGTASAVYLLRAHRGGVDSPFSEPVTLYLGIPGGGTGAGQDLRIAA